MGGRNYTIILLLITTLSITLNFIIPEVFAQELNESTTITQNVFLSFGISLGILLLITSITVGVLKQGKPVGNFLDIVRDKDWYPSLAIFQFFLWTFVVLFAFFGIYLIRVFNGVFDAPTEIPLNLLALMGISVTIPAASGGLSSIKYLKVSVNERPPQNKLPKYSTMLQENGKPSLTRFQMWSWTFLSIVIYLVILFSSVAETIDNKNFDKLILPDIDPTLVILMGMSQGAYLGGKIIAQQKMEITGIHPQKQKAGQQIVITGNNFGSDAGIVIIGKSVIREVIPKDNNKIEVSIPKEISKGPHKIQVGMKGMFTEEKDYEVVDGPA